MADTGDVVHEPKAVAGMPKGSPSQPAAPRIHAEVRRQQVFDIFYVLLGFRIVNAIVIRTFFQPDEYFQALEPAWRLAFGPESGAWLTWEWEHQLRSSLHPALFGAIYKAAQWGMSSASFFPEFQALLLPVLPRVVQAVFAAFGDFFTWRLASTIFGRDSSASWAALWMTILNPWQWYCSTRTFSNSLETTLTIAALYFWPWEILSDAKDLKEKLLARPSSILSLRVSLLLAALAVVFRPTNLLIWTAVGGLTITRLSLSANHSFDNDAGTVLIREAALCGSVGLAISAASDRLFFGEWTFPAYKWLYFNISQSLAVFYGRNPWHYYLSQGIPLLSTTLLPFVAAGLFTTPTPEKAGSTLASNSLNALTFAAFFTIATLSMISHKEVRFIYPLLPILHVLAAPKLASYFSITEPDATGRQQPTTRIVRKPLVALIVILSAIIGGYLSLFHQAAPLSVTSFIRYEFERLHPDKLGVTGQTPFLPSHNISAPPQTGDELFALFLMPCHSTPWRSHLVHPTLRARALTCEPPLHTAPGTDERRDYLDEADRFYAADAEGLYGVGFLEKEIWPFGKRGQLADGAEEIPRYIVGFEGIEPVLERYLAGPGKTTGMRISRTGNFWNGFFNEDWRRQGKIVVWDTGVYPSETPEWVDKSLLHEEL